MRTGEVVLKQRVVAPAQLQRALAEQRATGRSLEDALVGLGFVTEETLWRSLAEAAGLPFFEGDLTRVQPAAAALVPEEFAREHRVCPVSFEDGVLQVVQANPFDVLAVEDLRQTSGCDVHTACATRNCIDRLIESAYRPSPPVAPPPEPGPAQPVAQAGPSASEPREEAQAEERNLDDLGLGRKSAVHFSELLARTQGIIVVTGPAGGGKKTTVRASLSFLRDRVKNIVMVEKPLEPDEPGAAEDAPSASDRFAAAVRGLLPDDPDVIVIGDLSTLETADLAVRAALSGALVFGTLDLHDSAAVPAHLVAMGIDASQVASALVGVVSQRLARVVCAGCRRETSYAEGILAKVGLAAAEGVKLYRGRGCDRCGGTGFTGRTGVFEVLRVEPEIQDLIRDGTGADGIREAAVRRGMRTQFDDVLSKALFGTTTFEEVLKIAGAQRRQPFP